MFFAKRYLLFLIFGLVFLLLPYFSKAKVIAANFTTDYAITYTVAETSLTTSAIQVTLTNTTDDYYASSYAIEVGFDDISNVKASDPGGPIKALVEKSENGNKISLDFNRKVVGLGNKLIFHVSFDTRNVAQKRGKVWEINIPGIAKPENFENFSVKVHVPDSFGNPTYIKPNIESEELLFTKQSLGKSGISLAFGAVQYYDFSLTYHLRNTNVFPITTEIALPPNTNYQSVYLSSIVPPPRNVIEDADGNWLAEYYLYPSQKFDVIVSGKSSVSLEPHRQPMSETELEKYVVAQPYWEVKNKTIAKKANELATPKAIYDYVVQTLRYDFTRVSQNLPRLGAKGALDSPTSAVCREFTDLFIALTRAAGIPARELNGFAYTENAKQRPLSLVQDILHAWPEYYDREKQSWIMVDPTWGNTTGGVDYFNTFDFDHFVFAIKGIDSEYPVPAGGYKYEGLEGVKDVSVFFTENLTIPQEKLAITPELPEKIFPWSKVSGTIVVKNVGGQETSSHTMSIDSQTLKQKRTEYTVSKIPPYGLVSIPFSFSQSAFLTNTAHKLTITINNQSIEDTVTVTPFIFNRTVILGGLFIAAATLIISIIAIKTWRLHVQRQRGNSSVRGKGSGS